MPEAEMNPFPESAGTLLEKWGKFRIANQARNMLNNQRISNNCHKQDAAYRELGMDMLRHQNEQAGVKSSGVQSAEEDMEVRFDSPQTITNNHYHPAPPPVKKGLGTLGKLALAGGLLATGAAPFAIPLAISAWKDWKQPSAVQPAPDTDTDTTGEIMLWPPKGHSVQ